MDLLREGDSVEVMGSGDGLVGTYQPAVIMALVDGTYARVEYKFFVLEDEITPLREIVHHSRLRREPPSMHLDPTTFRYGEVDVWWHDVWWHGHAIRRMNNGAKYIVQFDLPRYKGQQFMANQIRHHGDWFNTGWRFEG